MNLSHDNLPSSSRSSGSAFRRVGATVAVACAVTGSIIGLGAMGALAVPSSSSVATPAAADASESDSTADSMSHSAAKATFTEADRAAFAASPYAEEERAHDQVAYLERAREDRHAHASAGGGLRVRVRVHDARGVDAGRMPGG